MKTKISKINVVCQDKFKQLKTSTNKPSNLTSFINNKLFRQILKLKFTQKVTLY